MMKIYTKKGDDGETGLVGGNRMAKDDARIEAYGTIDELSATLGIVAAESLAVAARPLLQEIQNHLFVVGAELATLDPTSLPVRPLSTVEIAMLEAAIDRFELELPPLTTFILPGGTKAAAALHLARTVCRRAERRVVGLNREAKVTAAVIPYLNRLSDLLFVMARAANRSEGVEDIPWRHS